MFSVVFSSFILMLILSVFVFFFRIKIKKYMKLYEDEKFKELKLDKGVSGMTPNETVIWAKFLISPSMWVDIKSTKVLDALKLGRIIEVAYYLNFLLLLVFFLFLISVHSA